MEQAIKLSGEYRTHTCSELREENVGETVKISGWVENIRDHGGVIFLDLRDHYGVTQVVLHDGNIADKISRETVITASGKVLKRDEESINDKIPTGRVEVHADNVEIISKSESVLPFEVPMSTETREDIRLKYRFLDLRNKKMHSNIVLRSKVISYMRRLMEDMGFMDIQTPILSVSSPEGARDYLVPSRKYHGKFYALPQAPQIFKQLLMVSGFDRYYQVAPCFRDEDARADRSPGEFYQLDFEMAFATQEDVFAVTENLLYNVFTKFSDKKVSPAPFERITYADSMMKYGTDKPDLRNPLIITDLSDIFENADFPAFKGKPVRGIFAPGAASQSRKFFEDMLKFATSIGMKGLGYIKIDDDFNFAGPIDKFIPDDKRSVMIERAKLEAGGVLFFICDDKYTVDKLAGQIRTELGERLGLINEDEYRLCFIVDFPMYDRDEETGEIIFTHNPFSMPQGGMEALETKDPLEVLAYQYDIVCNGEELSSGAVRNHSKEIMLKAFSIAGYSEDDLKTKFGALYSAFGYGAPPHAGMAPGIDRIIMLLTGEKTIRDVIAFPMNANAQDLMLGAPSEVSEQQLREVHIKIR